MMCIHSTFQVIVERKPGLGPMVSFKEMREGETDLAHSRSQPCAEKQPALQRHAWAPHPRDEIMAETRGLKPSVAWQHNTHDFHSTSLSAAEIRAG